MKPYCVPLAVLLTFQTGLRIGEIVALKWSDIDYDENDCLFIKRELYANGKSICKINNQTVTLNQLKQISEYIGDIHSQLETFGLINPKNYLSFIKNEVIDNTLPLYIESLSNYKKKLNELKLLENKIIEDTQKQDYLIYQINELEKASLSIDEENLLQNELKVLSNSENVKNLLVSFKEIYNERLTAYEETGITIGEPYSWGCDLDELRATVAE